MGQPGWLGTLRITILYLAGVFLGSLGAAITNPKTYLVGASAGGYTLIIAHLATLILNWNEDGQIYNKRVAEKQITPPMNLNPWIRGFRLTFVVLFVVADIGMIIYNEVQNPDATQTTSYAGHAFGALTGLLIGVFVLKNRKVEDWEVIFQWIAFGIFGLLLCVGLLWHLVGENLGWFLSEAGPTCSSTV